MKKNSETTGRFTVTQTKEQEQQLLQLEYELRWNRSKIVRLAVDLLFKTHRKNPKIYGV